MTYRDDREALHARAAALEAELEDAQRELELLRARNALAGEEAERLRCTIERLSGQRRTFAMAPAASMRQRPWWVWAYVASVVLGMLSFVAFAGSVHRSASPIRYHAGFVPRVSTPTIDLGVLPRVAPEPARVELPARVIEASGLRLAAGTECTLRAEIVPQLEGLGAKLDVDCPPSSRRGATATSDAAVALYRWDDEVRGGVSMRDCRAWERPQEDGSVRYAFDCRDEGARREGRPELRLETAGGRLDVFQHEGARPLQVSFEVPELSTPWRGRPLLGEGERGRQPFPPVERTGRVSRVNGPGAPAATSALCTVRVEDPVDSRFGCRAFVRCAGQLVYGAGTTGYLECTLEDSRPVRGHDPGTSAQDGDASLDLDLEAGRVVLGDRVEDGAWSMVITLEER